MIRTANHPRLAIIGRPNVGKSTLFNRFAGHRKAIIAPSPGVTRDPISQEVSIDGQTCMLLDTGGLTESREYLDTLIVQKSFSVIEDADIILLLLDITELTPEDEQLIERLRPFSQQMLVAVNKVDNEQRLHAIYEYHRFGFASLFPISASHGLGMDELSQELGKRIQAIINKNKENDEESDGDDGGGQDTSLVILGQPNTGKSTLSNLLSGGEHSIVSTMAGTTRDVLEREFTHNGQRFRLLDTAGIRRKRTVQSNLEYYSVNRAIAAIEQAEIVFLLMDAEKGLAEQDKKIAAQAAKHGRGIILVLNKWDLVEDVSNRLQAMTDRIRFVFPVLHFAPILPLSALNGKGVEDLLKTTIRLRQQLHCRIATAPLNKKLAEWREQTPPPSRKGFLPRAKYIVQVSNLPMKFILFVNRKKGFPESYVNFIKNRIREEFQIAEIPIQLETRGPEGR